MSSVIALPQRVAALEQQLDELKDQLDAINPASSTLSPSVLTLNPDGTIGADFTGKVQATELDLTADPTTPSPIRWLRLSDGAQVAILQSDAAGNLSLEAESLTLTTDGSTPATFSGFIQALGVLLGETDGSAYTKDSAVGWEDAGGTVREFVQGFVLAGTHVLFAGAGAGAGLNTVVLIDSIGESSFLQLAGGIHQVAVDYGHTVIGTGAGGSGSTVVNHLLGRVPSTVVSSAGSPNFAAGAGGSASWTSSQFTITVNGPANSSTNVSWIAIG